MKQPRRAQSLIRHQRLDRLQRREKSAEQSHGEQAVRRVRHADHALGLLDRAGHRLLAQHVCARRQQRIHLFRVKPGW